MSSTAPRAQSPDLTRPTYSVLGLPFDAVDMAEAVRQVEQSVLAKRRCFISTPNVNFAMAARDDRRFRQSVLQSDLVLADGQPIVWAARLAGVPIQERVSGAGLFEQLQKQAVVPIKVYFFGGPEGAAQAAHEALNAAGGLLRSVGFCSPGFGSTEELSTPAILDPINQAQPDFLVVALGAKKGQEWIVANLARLDAPVISHLGAVVNFTAGTVQRAPLWVQRLAMEWVWRIVQEPQLWRRYWTDGKQLLGLLVRDLLPQALRRVRASGADSTPPAVAGALDQGVAHVALSGQGSDVAAHLLGKTVQPWLLTMDRLELDCGGLQGMSPRLQAVLLQLEGSGVRVHVLKAPGGLAAMLRKSGCGHWVVG